MKHKILINVVPQILRSLTDSLIYCKGTFECNVSRNTFTIYDLTAFTLTHSGDNGMIRLEITTENNSKSIYIDKLNLLELTVHFES